MGWATIRRMTAEDEARAIPRLIKFCERHNIEQVEHYGPDTIEGLTASIAMWCEEAGFDYRAPHTEGQRMQMARRVWQRAVREPAADFGAAWGYIGYHLD